MSILSDLPSNTAKIVAAFVAGVVIALGGSLIYVKVADSAHAQSPVQTVYQQPAAAPANASAPQSPDDRQTKSNATESNPAPSDESPARPSPSTAPSQQADSPSPASETAPQTRHRRTESLQSRPHSVPRGVSQKQPATIEVASTTYGNIPAPPIPAVPSAPVNPLPATAQPAEVPPVENQPNTSYTPLPAPAQHVVTLPAGTSLTIRLGETLSSDHSYSGDTFRATLESQIVQDGFIIADRGSKVLGRVISSQRAGRVTGVSELQLTVTEISTTDGQRIPIASTNWRKAGSVSTGQDAAEIAGGAALGAIIGAIAGGGKGAAIGAGAGGAAGTGAVLLTRGKSVSVPTETRLNFSLARPVTITEKLNN